VAAKGSKKPEPEAVALARIKHRTIGLAVDRFVLLTRTAIKGFVTLASVYLGHKMVEELANGKIDWNAVATAVLQGHITNWICMTVAGIAIATALRERNLRRAVTSSQAEYIKKLEQIVDPHRSSSNLLPGGTNKRGDADVA
jgi:hypothetical protein